MRHRSLTVLVPLLTIPLLLAFRPVAGAGADLPQDLGDRVAALEARVVELEAKTADMELLTKSNAVLEQKAAAHEELLRGVYAWLRTLPAATQGLVAKVDSARENGFEKAGPNPRAKTDVLEGLRAFARSLNAANPTKAKPDDE